MIAALVASPKVQKCGWDIGILKIWTAPCHHTSSSCSTDLKSNGNCYFSQMTQRRLGSVAEKYAENCGRRTNDFDSLRLKKNLRLKFVWNAELVQEAKQDFQTSDNSTPDLQISQDHIFFLVSPECFSVFLLFGCGFFFIHFNSSHGNSKRGQTHWVFSFCCCCCCAALQRFFSKVWNRCEQTLVTLYMRETNERNENAS